MHKAAKHKRAGQSATTQKQEDTVGESQHVVEHHLQLAVFSNPTKKSNSARGGQKKKLWPQAARDDARRISLYVQSQYDTTLFFLFRTFVWCMHAASWVVSLEHGALDIFKSAVCTWNREPVCPFHSHCFCSISVRAGVAGGCRPRSEAPCTSCT